MFRLLLFLALLGAGTWFFLRPGPSPVLPWIHLTFGRPAEACRSSLRNIAGSVLQPLASSATGDQGQAIEGVKARVGALRSGPDYPALVEAVRVLQQANQDRRVYLQRFQSGSTEQQLDYIPGKWHQVGQPNATVDRTALNHTARSGFFSLAAAREWNQRAAGYRLTLTRLLDSPVPPPVSRGQ